MTFLAGLLPKLLVFGVTALLSGVFASVAVASLQDRAPASTAGLAPEYLLAGADTPAGPDTPAVPGAAVAFNEEPNGEQQPLATLSPEDLQAVAAALLGGEPVSFVNPSGFPRIAPVTQFDGGPHSGANCMLTSGAMLVRLGFGVVTTGSTLRTLQDDQDGGTGLNDLATALWRGYGISLPSGLIRPNQLKSLLAAGYGAAVQGDYSKIPRALRLQKDYLGGHAIYLDGYYPGDARRGIPEAYYVIDPLGRPQAGYEGDWWPASAVDDFARAFAGGRVAAMWAFPPGGVAPEVVGPDVLPIPPDPPGGGGPAPTPDPSASASVESPTPDPSASASAPPSGPSGGFEPGDLVAELTPARPPAFDAGRGGFRAVPVFDFCLLSPGRPGCPAGLEAVFRIANPPVLQLPVGPKVDVVFVDSDRANVVIVGFTVDPAAAADVHFWEVGASPATVRSASTMSSISLFGTTVLLGRLDVKADTMYRFQAIAGSGLFAGQSEIGSFTTGSGVEQFDVRLSQAASPVFMFTTGLSPYLHLAEDAYARPMLRLAAMGGATCRETADFGTIAYCVDVAGSAPPAVCNRAEVSYGLAGIDGESVAVRAFPAEAGVGPGGAMTLGGVLEATGAVPADDVSVGCLASGMTYRIVLDVIGDDRGVLAVETVTVP